MNVYLQKPDLDTCLTALILGVTSADTIMVLRNEAPADVLADPAQLCIEAGGSGQLALNNFDHHDPAHYHPPACRQAFDVGEKRDENLRRLVKYVSLVDEGIRPENPIPFPSLSNLFSGMLLTIEAPRAQLFAGIDLLRTVVNVEIDPFGTMPDLPEWQAYRHAKEAHARKVAEANLPESVRYFRSRNGARVGYLALDSRSADLITGPGLLYAQGCDVAVIYSPAFGNPPLRKFTIAGQGVAVGHLAQELNELEAEHGGMPGWGGRETIIGSPRHTASRLAEEAVLQLVLDNL